MKRTDRLRKSVTDSGHARPHRLTLLSLVVAKTGIYYMNATIVALAKVDNISSIKREQRTALMLSILLAGFGKTDVKVHSDLLWLLDAKEVPSLALVGSVRLLPSN